MCEDIWSLFSKTNSYLIYITDRRRNRESDKRGKWWNFHVENALEFGNVAVGSAAWQIFPFYPAERGDRWGKGLVEVFESHWC